MTNENIRLFLDLNKEFQNACIETCKILGKIKHNKNWEKLKDFEIDQKLNQVYGKLYNDCNSEYSYMYFPLDYITFTSEEIEQNCKKKK